MFSSVRSLFNPTSPLWHQLLTAVAGTLLGLLTFIVSYLVIMYIAGRPMPRFLARPEVLYKLCAFRWYRKWYGGRWEEWIVDDYFQTLWLPSHTGNRERPPGAHGSPNVETYKWRR